MAHTGEKRAGHPEKDRGRRAEIMKTGIFGGSFNPVHNGHIHLAETIMHELKLDRVIFVPSRISPHRSMEEYVSGEHRLEMLRLACKNRTGLEVSSYELDTDRVSYSIYTVEHFRQIFPDDDLFLLVGSDMLLCFDKWYRFEDILAHASLAVASRQDGDQEILDKKAEELSEYGRIFISRSSPEVVSSTEIRKKIAKNCDLTCYLDENVVQYIRLNGLYCKNT